MGPACLQTELWGAALQVFDYLNEERVVINSLNVGQSNAHKTEQVRMCSPSLPAISVFLLLACVARRDT